MLLPSSPDRPEWLEPKYMQRTSKLHTHNGENDLANLLTYRNYYWLYEPFSFPILLSSGHVRWFRPDFWVAESEDYPEMYIELTTTGQYIDQHNQPRLNKALAKKRQGVQYLRRYYNLPTVLIHYHQWQRIQLDHRQFDRVVRRQLRASYRARKVPWCETGAVTWENHLPQGTISDKNPNVIKPAVKLAA